MIQSVWRCSGIFVTCRASRQGSLRFVTRAMPPRWPTWQAPGRLDSSCVAYAPSHSGWRRRFQDRTTHSGRRTIRFPEIRRVFVPADRPDLWPNGDWQPMPLPELERQLEWAAAGWRRPRPFIERADYSATFVDGELRAAQVEWHVRRPDPFWRTLAVGRMNLNLSKLAWPDSGWKPQQWWVRCGPQPCGGRSPTEQRRSSSTGVRDGWLANGSLLGRKTGCQCRNSTSNCSPATMFAD